MKRVAQYTFVSLILLSLPFVFGAPWTVSDYVAAAALLTIFGIVLALIPRSLTTIHKTVAILILTALLLYVWAELAVGLVFTIGS